MVSSKDITNFTPLSVDSPKIVKSLIFNNDLVLLYTSFFISGYSQHNSNSMEDMINDVGRVNYLKGYLSSISSAVRWHA
jgi:hypothetical protein